MPLCRTGFDKTATSLPETLAVLICENNAIRIKMSSTFVEANATIDEMMVVNMRLPTFLV